MEALRKRGISITEAAEKGGIPYITIWRHCHGKNALKIRTAQRYAEKLGIPIAEIIGLAQGQGAETPEGNGE